MADQQRRRAEIGDGRSSRQNAFDDPWLPAKFGDDPTKFGCNPGEGDGQDCNAQQPWIGIDLTPYREDEEGCSQEDEEHAEANHDPEGPEQCRYIRNRVPGRLVDLSIGRLARIVHVTLQEQGIAEIRTIHLEGIAHFGTDGCRTAGLADALQGVVGKDTLTNANLGVVDQLFNAGNDSGSVNACRSDPITHGI